MCTLRDFMSSSSFYDVLCSLDYSHMEERDKRFITSLYEHFEVEKEDMELSEYQYARLNEIDFIQPDYIYDKNFKQYLKPYIEHGL